MFDLLKIKWFSYDWKYGFWGLILISLSSGICWIHRSSSSQTLDGREILVNVQLLIALLLMVNSSESSGNWIDLTFPRFDIENGRIAVTLYSFEL